MTEISPKCDRMDPPIDMVDLMIRVEAILFSSPDGITIDDLKRTFPNISFITFQSLLFDLTTQYQTYHNALEIGFDGLGRYRMQVKHEIMKDRRLNRFTQDPEYNQTEIQLLAFIAYNQPIDMQGITDFLGMKAKKYLGKLVTHGMIEYCENRRVNFTAGSETIEMDATGYITTPFFADYFCIPNDIDLIKQIFEGKLGTH